jgi:general secretion pathway protein I
MILLSPSHPKLQSSRGFSLLEVLVAVAILAIALFAVIHSTEQASKTSAYLQDKLSANTLCADLLANVRTGVIPISKGDQKRGETLILGRTLQWEIRLESMGNSAIHRIVVTVSDKTKIVASLKAYVAVNRDQQIIL